MMSGNMVPGAISLMARVGISPTSGVSAVNGIVTRSISAIAANKRGGGVHDGVLSG